MSDYKGDSFGLHMSNHQRNSLFCLSDHHRDIFAVCMIDYQKTHSMSSQINKGTHSLCIYAINKGPTRWTSDPSSQGLARYTTVRSTKGLIFCAFFWSTTTPTCYGSVQSSTRLTPCASTGWWQSSASVPPWKLDWTINKLILSTRLVHRIRKFSWLLDELERTYGLLMYEVVVRRRL